MTGPTKNLADSLESFVAGVSDSRDILKKATLISLLYENRDREIIGVEVPGEQLPRIQNV